MTLLEKAKKEAKRDGRKLSNDVVKGLHAIQSMHELCRKRKGSPYKMYISHRGQAQK